MWGSLQQTLGSTPSPWSRTSKCTRVRSTRFSIILPSFQVHLRAGEGGRDCPGGHHRHVRPDQPDPEADLRRLRHHEPGEQSYRVEG